ncbi:MAG: GFA family protein [Acetobacteraceae bacterium]|jgi:hypothetical protein
MSEALLTGGCQCGAARYAISAAPLRLLACHCRECQKQSASAFGMSLVVPRAAVTLTKGDTRTWSRKADSGRSVTCVFCVVCGTRLWHAKEGFDYVSIKGGSVDEPVDFSDAIHCWTSSKLPGMVIPPDARQFAEEPA